MKKKISLLILSIILVLIVLGSTTYALFFKQDKLENIESYTSGILDIVVDNSEEGLGEVLTLASSLPLSDSEGKNSKAYKFKITNRGNLTYTFDLKLLSTTVDNAISSNYIKVRVDNNEPVLLSSLTDSIIVSDMILNPSKSKTISVRIWLDESTPNTQIGKTFSAKIVSDGVGSEPPLQLDESGANYPKLADGMIPVVYDESKSSWVKANITDSSSEYKWYDYTNKQWANAVLVTSTNRSTYQSASNGTVIPESDILAYYVWIPRYKYKVWNITNKVGTDSYNAKDSGIDIVFETGTKSSGTITCDDYSFASTPNQTCSGTNGEYYTHPAFRFGDSELEGIWVGKFEVSSSTPIASYGGGNSTSLTVRVKPNVNSWRYNPVSNFSYVIQNMQVTDNEYGLTTDKTIADSHMMKNMEWGAVAYLTNSNYGRCSDGTCSEVGINNNSSGSGSTIIMKTGCGAAAGSGSSTTCNEYNTATGMIASTTGNVYGIYDMSGGAFEWVMGNQSKRTSGWYRYDAQGAGSNFTYSTATAKYLDTYAYSISNSDQEAYNKARLGDATGENVLSAGGIGGWYDDYASFVGSSYTWFHRGGSCDNGSLAGIFGFNSYDGNAKSDNSSRASLIVY